MLIVPSLLTALEKYRAEQRTFPKLLLVSRLTIHRSLSFFIEFAHPTLTKVGRLASWNSDGPKHHRTSTTNVV